MEEAENELPEGEIVELPEEEDDVRDTDDGGAIVSLEDEAPPAGKSDFYANLAEDMPEIDLKRMASRFTELITRDKEAREKRDKQYEEGLRRTGLGDDAPGGASFQGASRVVHPLLTEVSIDFASRAVKELLPPSGPVKDLVVGEIDEKKLRKAKRKTQFMNWQLTVQVPEFRSELEQLFTQVPLAGVQYLKVTWNEARNRPSFQFVPMDDVLLPFAATNFYSAQRKTHVQYITKLEYENRVKSGMYRDVDLVPASNEPEQSKAAQANDKIEGRSETSYNEDGLRTIYEVDTFAEIEDEYGSAPYIITIDKNSSNVLSIYRNWEEDDDTLEELIWMIEFPFVPWRGAYPIGITHMAGGLSAAATGALRALLDAAHINNSQTMLKLKGGSRGGQTLNLQPTQVEEIEGGLNVDDVRKIAMPLPFNPPSPVLMDLLGFLVNAGKGVVRTALDDTGDMNPNAPVGTTLARIEQGMVVFSAIHARLHDAMGRLLRVLHRLNGMYLDDKKIAKEVGEALVRRSDFTGPMDVVPVSDPNIFSEAQRFAQVQAVSQRAASLPQLYNLRKVEERVLETLKIPNAKELLNPPLEPKETNAVEENVMATMGAGIIAFPDQNHIAHLQTHIAYLQSNTLGSSRLMAPTFIPAILDHLKQHIAFWYSSEVFKIADRATGTDVKEDIKTLKNKDEKQALDRMLAEASMTVSHGATDAMQALPPIIEQAIQMMQTLQPPPPMDPTQAALAETQRRASADQANLQLKGAALQSKNQEVSAKIAGDQADRQLEAAKLQLMASKQQSDQQTDMFKEQAEDRRKAAELNTREKMNSQDNVTAMELAKLEVMSGERFNVSTGTGINPNP